MKKAKIAELKNGLSRYLAHVKAGGTVVVFERDRPVAHLVPVPRRGRRSLDDSRLDELERRGIIRRGKGDLSRWLREHPPIRGAGGVLKALLEERRSGW
jgi:antitoxin (DNA-binding transcriptional repressor) of toxin-antitoxin stability system